MPTLPLQVTQHSGAPSTSSHRLLSSMIRAKLSAAAAAACAPVTSPGPTWLMISGEGNCRTLLCRMERHCPAHQEHNHSSVASWLAHASISSSLCYLYHPRTPPKALETVISQTLELAWESKLRPATP